MPAISVLLPCYNTANTLEEALESLSGQNFADFEIVAVDDGSTDPTADILQGWQRRDPRLRVIHQAHGGILVALNRGLAACQAPLVARMDGDDRCHPERLACQAAYLEANPVVDVVGCLVEGFPAGQVREGYRIYMDWLNSLVTDEDIRREIFVESPLAHPSVMFRRAIAAQSGGYQEHGWAEDYDLWLRFYLQGRHFGKVPQVLLSWREHPERLTRLDGRYSLENFLRAKAYYLARGPLAGRSAALIWGAGMLGWRLSKHLQRQGAPLRGFIDIDPRKIGRTRRGLPIMEPEKLAGWWQAQERPVLLAAVGSRGARQIIRANLQALGLQEAEDWWAVA
jgi:glycosyltransferase involved in cell wall biosynthesis